jgi:pimeloyl-ACP methyl ester carboxylesterase
MAERIAGAEVVVVPGVGHAVHLEDPDAVAALLIP